MEKRMTLKNLRERQCLTQKEIAQHLHITTMCYNNYEKEKRQIPITLLDELSNVFHVSPATLLWILTNKMPEPDSDGYVYIPSKNKMLTMDEFVAYQINKPYPND